MNLIVACLLRASLPGKLIVWRNGDEENKVKSFVLRIYADPCTVDASVVDQNTQKKVKWFIVPSQDFAKLYLQADDGSVVSLAEPRKPFDHQK